VDKIGQSALSWIIFALLWLTTPALAVEPHTGRIDETSFALRGSAPALRASQHAPLVPPMRWIDVSPGWPVHSTHGPSFRVDRSLLGWTVWVQTLASWVEDSIIADQETAADTSIDITPTMAVEPSLEAPPKISTAADLKASSSDATQSPGFDREKALFWILVPLLLSSLWPRFGRRSGPRMGRFAKIGRITVERPSAADRDFDQTPTLA
jgi:hypothetical protein